MATMQCPQRAVVTDSGNGAFSISDTGADSDGVKFSRCTGVGTVVDDPAKGLLTISCPTCKVDILARRDIWIAEVKP